jgi:hypothetical protein
LKFREAHFPSGLNPGADNPPKFGDCIERLIRLGCNFAPGAIPSPLPLTPGEIRQEDSIIRAVEFRPSIFSTPKSALSLAVRVAGLCLLIATTPIPAIASHNLTHGLPRSSITVSSEYVHWKTAYGERELSVDGASGTYWQVRTGGDGWLQADLGDDFTISSVNVSKLAAFNFKKVSQAWYTLSLYDAAGGLITSQQSPLDPHKNNVFTWNFNPAIPNVRSIRIDIRNNSNGWWPSIAELEATGAPTELNDTTPPVISGVAVDGITVSGAEITWFTDEPSDSQVEYGSTAAYGSSTGTDPALTTTHAMTLSELTSGSVYHFRVLSRDGSGNIAASSDMTFATVSPDVTPPILSVPGDLTVEASSSSGTTVNFSVTATDDTDPNPSVSCIPSSGSFFPVGSTAVSCTAVDASGNTSQAGFIVTVVSVAPPFIGSLSPDTGSTGTVVTINGSNFGSSPGTGSVSFSGVPATPTAWSDTTITAAVPTGAVTGPVVVTAGGEASNAVVFTVDNTRTIRGIVTAADGITPIAGATVSVYDGPAGVGAVTTDAQGEYSVGMDATSGDPTGSDIVALSTRAYVGTGNSLAISGFMIQGTDPMTLLIRSTGPGLVETGVSDVLPNPYVWLYSPEGGRVAQNDDWQATDPLCGSPVISCGDAQAIIETGLDPCAGSNVDCNLESAMLVTLPPGTYTALMYGVGTDPTGIGLISVIDIDPASASKLVHVSTRADVELGEGSTRADFIIQGNDLATVLIKTTGPQMQAYGLDPLADPVIELYSGQTLIAQNDDWQATDAFCGAPAVRCGDAQSILDTGSDPCVNGNINCELDSALLVTLPPGEYSVDMRGGGSDPTGIGLVAVTDFSASINLLGGNYTVQASAAGYLSQSRGDITVDPGQTAMVDFSLEAGGSVTGIADDWSPKINLTSGGNPVAPIHLSLLPDGELIAMGPKTFRMTPPTLGQPLPAEVSVTEMSGQVPYEESVDSLYCSGHVLLGDGVFFTVGGISAGYGIPYAMSYDDSLGWMRFDHHMLGTGDTEESGPRHWYPSATLLADSRVLVTAGRDLWQGFYSENRSVEIFDPASATWSLASPHATSPPEIFNFNYSHVFQLPRPVGDFDIVMIGEDGYPVLFSTATGQWQVGPSHRPPGSPVFSNLGTSTLMLPIRLNEYEWGYSNGSIMMAGGNLGTDYSGSADVYDPVLNAWRELDLGVQRTHASEVLLPDGRILVVAGYNNDTNPDRVPTGFAEIIDPADNFSVSWSRNPYPETRAYHTVALLMPDGRVLVGGGNDANNAGNEKPDFRFYYPDYFEGSRPVITDFPEDLDYNGSYSVGWSGANTVGEVVLLAVGSMTHSVDFSQRHIQLQIQGSYSGTTSFLGPANASVAPPGYYMLFVLDESRKPSVGKIVHLGNPPATLRTPGRPMVAVQRSGGNSGATELHLLSRATNFRDLVSHIATSLPETDDSWSFRLADWDGDSVDDLVAIQKNGTASGKTEIRILSGASGYQAELLQTATALAQSDDRFDFEFSDWDGDSVEDLIVIIKSGTGTATTEVHILSGASNFQTFILHTGTSLAESDDRFVFGFEDYNGDSKKDLYIVIKNLTGSSTTEVHVLSGADNFKTFLLHTGSVLPETDASWDFRIADWNRDSKMDLVGIHKYGAASAKTEVQILSGATRFQSILQQMETVLPETDDTYRFLIN